MNVWIQVAAAFVWVAVSAFLLRLMERVVVKRERARAVYIVMQCTAKKHAGLGYDIAFRIDGRQAITAIRNAAEGLPECS